MAGILTNVLIIIFIKTFVDFSYQKAIIDFNLLMIIFNLLPIYPLDGYRIISHLLGIFFEFEYVFDLMFYLTLIFLFLLFVFGIIFKSFALIFLTIFLTIKLFIERKKVKTSLHLNSIIKLLK